MSSGNFIAPVEAFRLVILRIKRRFAEVECYVEVSNPQDYQAKRFHRCNEIARTLPTIFLVLSCLLVAGCHRPVEKSVEHTLTDALPRYLGDADKWTTRVGGRPDALYRGRLRTVHIEGVNVRLLPNLLVNRLVLDVDDVSVNRKTNTLEHIGAARFSARFTEAVLQKYIASRPRRGLRDVSLVFGADGTVTVTARPEIAGFATLPVSLRGAVSLDGSGTRLLFAPDNAAVDVGIGTIGSGLPAFVAEHIAEQVNPVADLSAAPVPIIADSVTVEAGAATIIGRIPADALRKRFGAEK